MTRSPTSLLREGIAIPSHGCSVPWLITKAELFDLLPADVRGVSTASPNRLPSLKFDLLGYEAIFALDFVSHPERRLFIVTYSNDDEATLAQTFAAADTALKSTLRGVAPIIEQDEHLRWEADGLWIDNSIHEFSRNLDGPRLRMHTFSVTAGFALPFARAK